MLILYEFTMDHLSFSEMHVSWIMQKQHITWGFPRRQVSVKAHNELL